MMLDVAKLFANKKTWYVIAALLILLIVIYGGAKLKTMATQFTDTIKEKIGDILLKISPELADKYTNYVYNYPQGKSDIPVSSVCEGVIRNIPVQIAGQVRVNYVNSFGDVVKLAFLADPEPKIGAFAVPTVNPSFLSFWGTQYDLKIFLVDGESGDKLQKSEYTTSTTAFRSFLGGALLPSAQGKDLGYVVKVSIPDNDCNGEIDSFHYVLVAELKDDNGGLQQVKKYLAYDQATEKVWLE